MADLGMMRGVGEPDVGQADLSAKPGARGTPAAPAAVIPAQYERLLMHLERADDDLKGAAANGRSANLEAASSIVFDLLYSLDFRNGGELVPRLAALYGYFANELLAVGRTRDRAQLGRLRDMIGTLRQSWQGAAA